MKPETKNPATEKSIAGFSYGTHLFIKIIRPATKLRRVADELVATLNRRRIQFALMTYIL